MMGALKEIESRHSGMTSFEWRDGSGGVLPDPPAVSTEVARAVSVHANAEYLLIADFIHRCDELGLATPGQLPFRLHEESLLVPTRPIAADDVFALPTWDFKRRSPSTTGFQPACWIGRTTRS